MDIFDIQLFNHFFAAGGLLRLGHIGREARNKLLQFLFLFLGLFILHLLLSQGKLTALVPVAVVAGKHLDLPKINIHGMGTDCIQKVPVMGYHQNGVFVVSKVIFKPGHRIQVQVVSRLIQ